MARKKKANVDMVSLKMSFPEERYFKDGVGLEVQAKGAGSSVAIAISNAVSKAFEDPVLKRKSPAYINVEVTVLSRWLLGDEAYAKLP